MHRARPTKKADLAAGLFMSLISQEINGRGERIRTSGPCLPKTVLYQAELLPDRSGVSRFRKSAAGQERAYKGGFPEWQAGICKNFRIMTIILRLASPLPPQSPGLPRLRVPATRSLHCRPHPAIWPHVTAPCPAARRIAPLGSAISRPHGPHRCRCRFSRALRRSWPRLSAGGRGALSPGPRHQPDRAAGRSAEAQPGQPAHVARDFPGSKIPRIAKLMV